MGVLLEGSLLSTEQCWSSVIDGFLVISMTMALLLRLLRVAGGQLLEESCFQNSFHLYMKATLWTFRMLQKCFCALPQIFASIRSCLRGLHTIPWMSWLGLCPDMQCQIWDLIQTDMPFPIMSSELNASHLTDHQQKQDVQKKNNQDA